MKEVTDYLVRICGADSADVPAILAAAKEENILPSELACAIEIGAFTLCEWID